MATLTASRLWLDSLRPITDESNNLTEIIALVNIEFVDENGNKVFIKHENINTFGMTGESDLIAIQTMFQTMIDGLKQLYGIV